MAPPPRGAATNPQPDRADQPRRASRTLDRPGSPRGSAPTTPPRTVPSMAHQCATPPAPLARDCSSSHPVGDPQARVRRSRRWRDRELLRRATASSTAAPWGRPVEIAARCSSVLEAPQAHLADDLRTSSSTASGGWRPALSQSRNAPWSRARGLLGRLPGQGHAAQRGRGAGCAHRSVDPARSARAAWSPILGSGKPRRAPSTGWGCGLDRCPGPAREHLAPRRLARPRDQPRSGRRCRRPPLRCTAAPTGCGPRPPWPPASRCRRRCPPA